MPKRNKRQRKATAQELANLKSARTTTDSQRQANGSLRSQVRQAYRTYKADGQIFLVTRSGRMVDGRTNQAKRYTALVREMVQDLGGPDNVSTMEHQLVCNAAAIGLDLEYQIAQALQENEPLDPDVFRNMASTQRQLLQALGLKRRSRNVVPDPLEYARRGRTFENGEME